MMRAVFPVDIRGEWTEPQANAVIKRCQETATVLGLELEKIEITMYARETRWFLIAVRCMLHQVGVAYGEVCPDCLRGVIP